MPRWILLFLLLVAPAAGAPPASAAPEAVESAESGAAAAPAAPEPAAPQWVRVVREGRTLALEIALRRYVRPDGEGPAVVLAGVVHVGDEAYYRALQEDLAECGIVLYEGVRPDGAGTPGGETEDAKAASSRVALEFLARLVARCAEETVRAPESLSAFMEWARERAHRFAELAAGLLRDGWGRELLYERVGEDAAAGYRLTSLGGDGAPGGEGTAADLVATGPAGLPPFEEPEGDSLQKRLADLLSLSFQIETVDYEKPNWRWSDMSFDQVNAAIEERGGDSRVLGTLTGTNLSGMMARFGLTMLEWGDALTGGTIGATMRAFLVEMLGSPDVVELGPFDEATMDAILLDRNAFVVEDFRRLTAETPDVESVAIFYGAAHMPDFAERFAALGYAPAPDGERWRTAIRIDLDADGVNETLLRMLLAQARRQFGAARRGR